jgi:two-component system, NarL family, sensor histidine kinase DevS
MTDKQSSVPTGTSTPEPRHAMVFPQIARLELDDLLTQLIERAQDVLETQGRLRALLSATRAVSEDLSVPLVLRRIVESACQLIGARYGAIGVLGPDGTLDQFIHVGMDDDVAAQIGHLPTGRGILGLLIEDPRPLRLDDLQTHDAAVGFPATHPEMRTFLGVPVRVRDHVFGNIYLTEKAGGREFTADDEELLVALAGTAAVAIDHAQLFAEAQARQDALAAAAELTRLTSGPANPLAVMARQARHVTNADLCTVIATDPSGKQRVVAADGVAAGAIRGVVVSAPSPEAVATDLRAYGADLAVTVSLKVGDAPDDELLLLLSRGKEGRSFSPSELESARVFADQASRVLSENNARHNARLVELLSQRDAIARDMNDQVVSRLFSVGMALQGIQVRIGDDDLRASLGKQIDHLDETIKTIRTSIFNPEGRTPGG